MRRLKDFKLKSKKVLVRCDFNVPIKSGKILDDFRIKKTIPTIKYLIKKRAKIILMSHLGKPKDREKEYSLKPIAKRLEKLLKRLRPAHHPPTKGGPQVKFLKDCIGKNVKQEVDKMKDGEIVLLENLRFQKGEEKGDENFAKKLASLGDFFIEDAFATCHRSHASIVKLPKYLPSATGLLLESEIKNLGEIIEKPPLPLVAIFGGDDPDFRAIDKISEKADWILIGGLIQTAIEEKCIKLKYPEKIIKPIDSLNNEDIGEKTIKIFKEKISRAKTVFWSGPFGKIEEKKFQKGTKEIVKAIIKSMAFSVVGGGETIDFINDLGLGEKFNHLSTGGSAMLEFLAGEKLPGIEALK
ncbi:hypothetical protein AMJ49_03005 [Parcubacteria bacterium DG_74_2]|nr:MAG: hypothetical protein AMJ49_03005 [Parcubacteria bacterium DG_74_2]